MSAATFCIGVILVSAAAFLPESEVRNAIGFVGVGCVLAAALMRERSP